VQAAAESPAKVRMSSSQISVVRGAWNVKLSAARIRPQRLQATLTELRRRVSLCRQVKAGGITWALLPHYASTYLVLVCIWFQSLFSPRNYKVALQFVPSFWWELPRNLRQNGYLGHANEGVYWHWR